MHGFPSTFLPLLRALLALILALTALCLHGALAASTITVNTTDDELNRDGDCSLREE